MSPRAPQHPRSISTLVGRAQERYTDRQDVIENIM